MGGLKYPVLQTPQPVFKLAWQLLHLGLEQFRQKVAPLSDHVAVWQAPQTEPEVAPTVVAKVPALQLLHIEARGEDQVPATQLKQTVLDVAAETEENVPALQLRHVDEDVATSTEDHEPRAQFIQVKKDEEEEMDEKVPTGQLMHNDAPDAEDQVPALHPIHDEPPAEG